MKKDIQMLASETIDRSIIRHGGMERWKEVDSILVEVYTLGGFAMSRRGLNSQFPMPHIVELKPKDGIAILYDYPDKGTNCIYNNGKVAQYKHGNEPAYDNTNHRDLMMSVSRFRRSWTIKDATYFFGYAMLHYSTLPYSLRGVKVVGFKKRNSGDWCTRIDVEYPSDSHTHSKLETMYFDATDLLVRHDYRPEVSSPVARAANFLLEYKDIDGYLITERRKVYFRLGRFITPLVVLDGGIRVLEITNANQLPVDIEKHQGTSHGKSRLAQQISS